MSFNAELDSWIANMTDGRGSASIGAPALDLVPLDLGMSPLPAQKSFFGSIARASEGSVDWRCGSTTGQRFAASLLVDLSS